MGDDPRMALPSNFKVLHVPLRAGGWGLLGSVLAGTWPMDCSVDMPGVDY